MLHIPTFLLWFVIWHEIGSLSKDMVSSAVLVLVIKNA